MQGRALVALIFVLAGAPAFHALRGIIRQIIHQPHYPAAITTGAGPWRLSRGHVLPNSMAHTMPLFLHIIGVAMAVYGVIGVFGFVNPTSSISAFASCRPGFDLLLLLLALARICVDFQRHSLAIWKFGRSA